MIYQKLTSLESVVIPSNTLATNSSVSVSIKNTEHLKIKQCYLIIFSNDYLYVHNKLQTEVIWFKPYRARSKWSQVTIKIENCKVLYRKWLQKPLRLAGKF